MSTIYCSGCGSEMSAQAHACPKCGKPTDAAPTSKKVSGGLVVGIIFIPIIFSWFLLRKGYSTTSRVIAFIWLALFIIISISSTNHSSDNVSASNSTPATSSVQKGEPTTEKLESYTIQKIAKAYEENTVSADQMFKNKRFKVTGTVLDISTDFLGTAYITMRGGVNEFFEPHLTFNDSNKDYAAKLKKGMKVSLVCTGEGDLAKAPMLKGCAPVK